MSKIEQLKETLRFALPSRTMLHNVSFGAIEVSGVLIVLKNRTDYFDVDSIIRYDKQEKMNHHYEELKGKSVIFDKSLLNIRGRKALREFFG